MSPPCVSLRHLSRSVLLLRPAVFSLDRSSSLSSVSIGPLSPFRSQFLDEADLLPALPEGVLRFYGSSPRLSHPWDLYEMSYRILCVFDSCLDQINGLEYFALNTVASTSVLGGPLKQLNKGGSRRVPFTVKRDDNNHSRDINQTGRQQQ
ncbi:hypothetical protein F2Q69_00025085 [Brassica cretica]|uniref:Uncharacterized protein n=1 Tax=Brassica cretica TaxID=69181 RepID=A0A8S9Q0G8_BRACR|nr:hypothetical protein F2Q69_00025085 [Brassica cretica]